MNPERGLFVAEVPFGGINDSGIGREGGTDGIADPCNIKLGRAVLP